MPSKPLYSLALLAFAVSPGALVAQVDLAKDLRLEPPVRLERVADRIPGLAVDVRPDRGFDADYKIGDPLTFTVRVAGACHVNLIELATSGSINQVVPRTPGGGRVRHRACLTIPAAGRFVVEGPAGEETVIAIASREPLPWIDDLYGVLTADGPPAPGHGLMYVSAASKDLRFLPEDGESSRRERVEEFCRLLAERVRRQGRGSVAFGLTRFRIR